MAKETSRFSALRGVLETPAKQSVSEPAEIIQNEVPESSNLPTRRGRPKGKRSSIDYEQTTVFLRADSKIDVGTLLKKMRQARKKGDNTKENYNDLSELLNHLLDQWLYPYRQKREDARKAEALDDLLYHSSHEDD